MLQRRAHSEVRQRHRHALLPPDLPLPAGARAGGPLRQRAAAPGRAGGLQHHVWAGPEAAQDGVDLQAEPQDAVAPRDEPGEELLLKGGRGQPDRDRCVQRRGVLLPGERLGEPDADLRHGRCFAVSRGGPVGSAGHKGLPARKSKALQEPVG
ncbi:unnamed protein product [Prorocentrum cordatum]|uniref:Uncharacterized protein n=1 Tax=Prorocentrum cordatum TaxID=2364126 RepID=A0ABN9XPP7_9DINO|nr:unnamed protein product [Polarella glacialis]